MKFKFNDEVLMVFAKKIATNRYLASIKDGFIFAMPFLMVGSFILLLTNLPFRDQEIFLYSKWYDELMTNYRTQMLRPYFVSMGLTSFFVVYATGSSLARSYDMNKTSGALLSIFSFFLLCAPADGQNMLVTFADARGLFAGILSTIFTIELYRFMKNKKLVITLHESVPPNIMKSFEALLPTIALIAIFTPINIWFDKMGTSFPQIIEGFFKPLIVASDSLFAVLLILLVIHLLWFIGLHGANIVIGIISPFMLANLQSNINAAESGVEVSKVFVQGFFDQFAHIGGAGATLGLAIAMIFSKSSHIKSIGKLSIIPGIFNINEPILFGAPVVMNPILGIPFILVPLINGTIAWFMIKVNIAEKIVTMVPWTTPAPLAAFLASGLSPLNFLLSVSLILLSIILYYPFVKIYEKSLEQ